MRARGLWLLLVAAGAAVGSEPKRPASKPPPARQRLGTPGYLGPLARQLLQQRMARHGRDMRSLLDAVLLLDRAATQRLASELAAEPRLTRPIAGGEDDLNASLPERFFVLQDELRSRSLALADAGRLADDQALAARLGELTQTCVSCHSTYLEPRPPTP